MLNNKSLLSVLLLFFMAENLFAYRPLGTEDAGVAGKGVFQTEVSLDYLKWGNDDTEQVSLMVPIYGLTDKLELSAEVPYMFHNPDEGSSEDGTGDINLVAKYLLTEEGEANPALAAKGVVKLDNGDYDRGLGSGDQDYSFFVAVSKTMNQVTVLGHLGYTWVGDGKYKNLRDITLYGVALDYALTEELHFLFELNGNRHPDRTTEEDDPRNALAGISYKVSEKLTLDLAYRWGLSDSVPDRSMTMGASITY